MESARERKVTPIREELTWGGAHRGLRLREPMRVSAAWRWLVGTLPENVMLFPARPLVADIERASRRFRRQLEIHESLHNAYSEGAALDSYWSLLCTTILDVHERRRRYAILAAQLHRERAA